MNMVNGAFNDDAFHRKKAGGAGPGGQGCQKALLGVSENGDSHRMASDLFMAKQCIPMDLIYIYIYMYTIFRQSQWEIRGNPGHENPWMIPVVSSDIFRLETC